MYEMILMSVLVIGDNYIMAQPSLLAKKAEAQVKPKVKVSVKTYDDHRAEAIANKLPMAIFVQCQERSIAGFVTCRVDSLPGYFTSVVVATPNAALGMAWKATLPTNTTDLRIRQAAGLEQLPAIPFFKRLQDRKDAKQTADANVDVRQLPNWFAGAIRYHHAERTQSIATTNNQHSIISLSRTSQERKWLFPGGLAEIGGWQSDLYKSDEVKPWRAMIPALNSSGSYQLEAGWYRSYPDGTWFADVLSTDGKPFEIRVREKIDGAWDSYVAFRDPLHYPIGYVPMTANKCMVCHQEAGQARYSGAAIPGSDSVISDPFVELEMSDGLTYYGTNRSFGQTVGGFLSVREYRH